MSRQDMLDEKERPPSIRQKTSHRISGRTHDIVCTRCSRLWGQVPLNSLAIKCPPWRIIGARARPTTWIMLFESKPRHRPSGVQVRSVLLLFTLRRHLPQSSSLVHVLSRKLLSAFM